MAEQEELVAGLVAELMLENPQLTIEECQAAVAESMGGRTVVAGGGEERAERGPPEGGGGGGAGGGEGGGDDDDAMLLLRRRYAESQAKQEVQRALEELDALEGGGGGAAAAAAPDRPEEEQQEEEEEPDDTWLMPDLRAAAREALGAEERQELDEALYAAAREGYARECERLIGQGAAFDGYRSAVRAATASPPTRGRSNPLRSDPLHPHTLLATEQRDGHPRCERQRPPRCGGRAPRGRRHKGEDGQEQVQTIAAGLGQEIQARGRGIAAPAARRDVTSG